MLITGKPFGNSWKAGSIKGFCIMPGLSWGNQELPGPGGGEEENVPEKSLTRDSPYLRRGPILIELNIHLLQDPAISLLGVYPR